MNLNIHKPIRTELGELRGRDCIYLDKTNFQNGVNTLLLVGELNGRLCSKYSNDDCVPYTLSFFEIKALKMVELDSWDGSSESSFDEVTQSSWISNLGGKVDGSHQHYLVKTYDEVFEVVCKKFTLAIN